MQDYLSFMEWFQNNHPDLHKKYWMNITIPTGREGVDVTGTNLEPEVFATLIVIEYDYYHPVG
jgi:hypothetical protein